MLRNLIRPASIGLLGFWSTPTDDTTKANITDASEVHDETSGVSKLPDSQLDPIIDRCSSKVQQLMLETGTPGLTICVSKNNHLVWHTAFGYCDVENLLLCDKDAHMRIASISKSIFSATLVGPLLDKGQVDLDASIHNFLSVEEFPRKSYQGNPTDITIKQLLSHTSGVKSYTDSEKNEKLLPIGSKASKRTYQTGDQYKFEEFFQRRRFRDVISALDPFKDSELASEPGKYSYTSYGYTLLSAVVQKIIQTFDGHKDEQIEDYWIKTLHKDWKLNDTHLDQEEPIIPKRARYYLRTARNGGLINAPFADNSIKWAGGGINSTTADLVKFGNQLIDIYKSRKTAHYDRKTLDILWKVVEEHYGLGFRVFSRDLPNGERGLLVYHTGGAVGASSVLVIFPDSEVVVAILTNLGDVNLKPLGVYIGESFERNK